MGAVQFQDVLTFSFYTIVNNYKCYELNIVKTGWQNWSSLCSQNYTTHSSNLEYLSLKRFKFPYRNVLYLPKSRHLDIFFQTGNLFLLAKHSECNNHITNNKCTNHYLRNDWMLNYYLCGTGQLKATLTVQGGHQFEANRVWYVKLYYKYSDELLSSTQETINQSGRNWKFKSCFSTSIYKRP